MRTLIAVVSFLAVSCPLLGLAENAKPSCPKEAKEGFVSLFDGKTFDGWQGAIKGYAVEKGVLVCKKHGGGDLLTVKEYGNFILRVEYKLQAGGNNGIGIRTKRTGIPAYQGMEIQLLDDSAPMYKKLEPVQYNGSIYGAVACKRGHMKPVGQWNAIEIAAKGSHVKITLNGAVIVDVDLKSVGPKNIHGQDLVGLHRAKGFIAFCGHGHRVEFRNIRIKELK